MSKVLLILIRLGRPVFKRLPKAELAAAICVAGIVDLREKWDGLRAALKTTQEVSDELKEKRLAVCRGCRIFDPLLHTCGSAIKDMGKPPADRAGCYCAMRIAAGTAHNCWLFDRGSLTGNDPGGWPSELNSFV